MFGHRLQGKAGDASASTTEVLLLTKHEDKYVFTNVPERPVPSLLRNFSAPVKLQVSCLCARVFRCILHVLDYTCLCLRPFCSAGLKLINSALCSHHSSGILPAC